MYKYIIYYFDIRLPDNSSELAELSFNVGLISLVVMLCFINIFGYLLSIHLLKYYNFDDKYPKINHIINYFRKSSWIFIVVEIFIGFGGLLSLIYLGLSVLFI